MDHRNFQVVSYEVTNTNVIIFYTTKETLEPNFGAAVRESNVVFIRNDLTGRIKNFVVHHELYHLTDPYIWGGLIGAEIRANWVAFKREPIAGIVLLVNLFISPRRWKNYYRYFTRAETRYSVEQQTDLLHRNSQFNYQNYHHQKID